MSETMRESLSALMDDEANELELQRILSRIGDDAELRGCWRRYHLARGAVVGQPMAGLEVDISAAVRDAIDREQGAAAAGTRASLQNLLRPLASLAVAASVAAVVVVGGQQLARIEDSPGGSQALASSVSPVGMVNSLGATTVQASYGTQPIPGLEPAARTAYRELARQRLNKYLQAHVEHAALNSPQGLLPFARVPQIKE